ncbi:T7SS effector LXG polymorphic toxin [Bacillus sonorensis]|uniref:T7SS effector LXG polymorphic toxin n=1 Tax=Bacillus sonorensis TaxID=119858 RepID=UPI00227E7778|nr:T7SS effector LXG polymorphic toxin [Bacillus sonorensis]MCY8035655.1 T7SS effector LXG polymorphic toxin [Bacillus sonorensis]MCY8563716.1 T7SS effector LXG polymorphic toxin [Bacillus sonorensis]
MKTLDVHALHHAIDQTLEQLKKQSEEIANLKKSVDGITSLDDALKGKGGDAIRAFYEECHTPFLRFYESFIEEYESELKKIKNALNSLEPNHNGFISQSFLEHELEQGLNAADRTTKHLVSKTNAAIAKVSHIVDLPDLNDNDFHEQNRKALTDVNQTIEKLHTFDREQTSGLKTAEQDLETMQQYIKRLEKMYTGPKIEIATYQKGSILKPDKIDSLQPNEDTPMEVMLKKVGEKEEAEINKLADTDRTATQKVSKKVYSDEELENLSEEELAKLKKVYKYVNGFKYCFYMDGKNVVGIKLVDDPPEDDEEVSDLEKYAGIGLELLGESDLERAALGYDPDTHERLSFFERVEAGVNLTPPARLIKWIRRGTKLAKVSKVGKGAKTPSYGKQSVPKGPYREVNGFPAKVKPGAQEKHIPGTPNYKQEVANGKKKSIFYGDNKKAQELLDKYAGKGEILKNGREVVDFGQKIGKAYDMKTGKYIETTRGTIHYSKDGAHIVPAKPLEP